MGQAEERTQTSRPPLGLDQGRLSGNEGPGAERPCVFCVAPPSPAHRTPSGDGAAGETPVMMETGQWDSTGLKGTKMMFVAPGTSSVRVTPVEPGAAKGQRPPRGLHPRAMDVRMASPGDRQVGLLAGGFAGCVCACPGDPGDTASPALVPRGGPWHIGTQPPRRGSLPACRMCE